MNNPSDIDTDLKYSVKGWKGIAFYCRGPEMESDEDTEWTGIENETGNVVMVMVGDDRKHSIDPDDLVVIDEEEYCSCCGQIGCQWG